MKPTELIEMDYPGDKAIEAFPLCAEAFRRMDKATTTEPAPKEPKKTNRRKAIEAQREKNARR